ncbi:hypothetical protein NDU88_007151 [Pleurodeles waltl]|uniref:Uncharacterized protein n=1 Tax=Pleurodeles waltl TaxID=8319 RepID=A0AAV7PKT3_PLEWA|nr:hypothetical protein NDU88_007151 [Pleurodeles waltl]
MVRLQHPTLGINLAVGNSVGRGWEKGPWRDLRSGKRTAALSAARAGDTTGAHGRLKERFREVSRAFPLDSVNTYRTAVEATHDVGRLLCQLRLRENKRKEQVDFP